MFARFKERLRKPSGDKKLVAVVTTLHRFPPTADEEVSLRHLRHYLDCFDRHIVAPRGLALDFPDFKIHRVDDAFFGTIPRYNRLMLSREFYRCFADYEYILIYHLDSLVFSGDLEAWCAKGWDYVGAPWFKGHRDDPTEGFWAVGNGGLSLRKVASALAVLNSKRIYQPPDIRANRTWHFASSPRLKSAFCRFKKFFHTRGYHNDVNWCIKEITQSPEILHEDIFWSFEARTFLPEFRVPAPEEAVAFSFEAAPRFCFRANGERLPFGCHAWAKYDRAFWEPYLLRG